MHRPFFNRHEVAQEFPEGSWESVLFAEFAAALSSAARPFPCIFAVRGFEEDQLRYMFLERVNVPTIACSLERYAANSRQFGPNTSLVVFFRPGAVCPIEHYERLLWSVLDDLVRIDRQPWPENIPTSMDDPGWEFCFAGQPMFVVCTTPAHTARQSRRSTGFTITFQPRWVFDKVLSTPKAADAVFEQINNRVKPYDFAPPSPHLGHYGDPNNREYLQYFLADDNGSFKCPFARLGDIIEDVA
jgi:uncharacterized protein